MKVVQYGLLFYKGVAVIYGQVNIDNPEDKGHIRSASVWFTTNVKPFSSTFLIAFGDQIRHLKKEL